MATDQPKLSEKELQQWKLVADFRERLEAMAEKQTSTHPTWEQKQRLLKQSDYLCLFLFALVNPTAKTLRAVAAASELKRVQDEVCTRQVSLGSLSEAQHLVDPVLLEKLIESLSQEIPGPPPTTPAQAWQTWMARDSSIFRALPRMVWAEHGAGKPGELNNAVRLHLSFQLWEDKPAQFAVTTGKVCERKTWKEQLVPGTTYVGDRHCSGDYKIFARLQDRKCQFVLRLRDEAVVAETLQKNPLSPDQRAAGIVSDEWVRLGHRASCRTGRVRVITWRKPGGTLLRVVTNLPPEQMTAAEIKTLYRRRWQIECFFRWIKCLLGCRHGRAESAQGVTLQLSLALIAGLLLQIVLGRRPTQRLWERLHFYLLGWATLPELMLAIDQAVTKASSKKS